MNTISLHIGRLLESRNLPGQFPAISIHNGAVTIGAVDRDYISSLPLEYGEDGFMALLDEAVPGGFFRFVVINLDDKWFTVSSCRKSGGVP